METDRSAPDLATEARLAVRQLDAATMPFDRWPGLGGPRDAYATLGELADLVLVLRRAVAQLREYLRQQGGAGRLDPWAGGDAIDEAAAALERAMVDASVLAGLLTEAATAVGRLHDDPRQQ